MTHTKFASKKEFYDSLPRKRSAVGVLVIQNDQILVLKPTYKDSWLIPGGVVDKGESIYQASVRECAEKIGVDVEITKLLVVDYKPGDSDTGDAIHFLFLGHLPKDTVIATDGKEIEAFKWVSPAEAFDILGRHLSLRVQAGVEALKKDQTVYCEDGRILI